MTPEQAHFLLNDVYLPQIKREFQTTRRLIEAIPADKGDYTPHETSMPAFKLAKHIASSEVFFISGVANGAFDPANAAIPKTVTTPLDLLVWYDEHFAKAVAKLEGMSGDDLAKDISFAIFNMPGVSFAGFMMSHSIHHRGQLSAYLRPMGAKVPSIYGGSADEPMETSARAS
jgi:uncharacterized damage-inducible protein DinB